ncbi:hypothetical protein KJY73_01190 [Bowmanella sp. Y26]|uniref:hypothetical protein n=1 Tax=Bowmanella yangjiangensis TaxID=2811230 RepID=UPI001BDBF4A9|nr:hypothetical protein [Bowmanella yangjiangensis]MBT1062160.1 hypothetical protein [Bowmanella yangjiangensis]
MKKALLVLSMCYAIPSFASDVDFSIGGGYPYFVVPEVSWSNNDSQRWYAKYNLGLDDGFNLGYEQALDDNQHHALGIALGAIGTRDVDTCSEEDDNVGDAFSCIISGLFDDHSVQGAALSYSYNFSGLNARSWRIKFEAGYGRVSVVDKNYASGNVTVSYQF